MPTRRRWPPIWRRCAGSLRTSQRPHPLQHHRAPRLSAVSSLAVVGWVGVRTRRAVCRRRWRHWAPNPGCAGPRSGSRARNLPRGAYASGAHPTDGIGSPRWHHCSSPRQPHAPALLQQFNSFGAIAIRPLTDAQLDTVTVMSDSDSRSSAAEEPGGSRWSRLRHEFGSRLDPAEQSAVISWGAFTTTFGGLRLLTHWIRGGHGPQGGGIRLGGRHFHHYNIGIALLSAVGAVGLRGSESRRRHPVVAVVYGSANALVVDELALLLDLKDVYWASEGRKSVDAAICVIAAGATAFAGLPFWPHAHRILRTGH